MKSERIVYTECQVTGEMGFVFKKLLNKNHGDITADTTGLLLAHDLIEHQNGLDSIGSVWDELEAVGAIWYVRGNMGALGNFRYTPEQSLATDLLNLANFVNFELIENKLKTYKKLRGGYIGEDMARIISHLKKADIESEYDLTLTSKDFNTYKNYCLYHMITGYRKAAKRFKSEDIAYYIFTQIEDKIKKIHSYDDLYEGIEYSVSYDKTGKVFIKAQNEENFY